MAQASTEIVKGDHNSLLKSKFFSRLTCRWSNLPFYWQLGATAGHIAKIGSADQTLRVNDAFYLPNFKGIRNVGYHFDVNSKKKGLGGDILGFEKFATLNLKLYQLNCPLLADFSIEPFAYLNFALAPNRNGETTREASWLSRHLRWSSGIGLSMQAANCSVECYYNILVGRQRNELVNNFQINFGID